MSLPDLLYRAAQVREMDRRASERFGVSTATLMQRAGAAALLWLGTRWPRARRIAVACGPGNNGGDGFVLARLAHDAGFAARVAVVGDRAPSVAAAHARAQCEEVLGAATPFHAEFLCDADVVVDALLGIGLTRPVTGPMRAAIDAINASGREVAALDVPSGLNADTGCAMGSAVRAQATLSFIGLKAGLFTGSGRELSGDITFADLAVPGEVYSGLLPAAQRLTAHALQGLLRRRARDAHKGQGGNVLVIGGDRGMPGAAHLAGIAAYRAGAGLVTLATHPDHASHSVAACPELLVFGIKRASDLHKLMMRSTVIIAGPGLGQGPWSRMLLDAAFEARAPLVLDADALNLLAIDPMARDDWILTPHPGEAGRLLNTASDAVQADRFAAIAAILARFRGVCVLKGSGTLVASEGQTVALCDCGNPGMASGGMGDVLAGVIGALRAQGLAPYDAARLGVYVHARAGDEAARAGGEIGLLASDLFSSMRVLLNGLSHGRT